MTITDKIIKKTDTLYRVQVGAFSVKSNAELYLKKVNAAGFPAFIVEVKSNALYSSRRTC